MAKKTLIDRLRAEIARRERTLKNLKTEEATARRIWTRGYNLFRSASGELAELTNHGTKKARGLRRRIKEWNESRSDELTARRDAARAAMAREQERLAAAQTRLAEALAEEAARTQATDNIVARVFELNDAVIKALEGRNDFLSANVYGLLVKSDGTLRSQITLDSSDGTRRVVALVNSITIVRQDLASQAIDLIENFFSRFEEQLEMDETTQALYQLTRKLLDIKTKFKVGPDLYRFLSLELDPETFPTLVQAQNLLKSSLRSEKTSSYVRLYVRKNRSDPWKRVSQS